MTNLSQKANPSVIIVTGLSGAGMSSVLKSLEDMNFEVFDNFPLSLVKPLVEETPPDCYIAVGIDTRTRGFSVDAVLEAAKTLETKLLFLTCDENVLQKRFTETRRKHPLAKDRPVADGIQQEQRQLWDLKNAADIVIDTSELSIHDLRRILEGHFRRKVSPLTITLKSFGFKNGLPRDADIVMDVRFLKNPNWVPDLKPKTGLDPQIGSYIAKDQQYQGFIDRFMALFEPLLPVYAEEGKNYLTIAIGCTGGHHRSVYIVERLTQWLNGMGFTTHTEHRDIDR